jgi:biopolymer transport protein ExbB
MWSRLWESSDWIGIGVAATLLLMSVVSWYTILDRLARYWKTHVRSTDSVRAGIERVVRQALAAYQKSGSGARDELADLISRTLARALARESASLETGITRLAAIGTTAPFVGLLGTVWGIHKALSGLAGHDRLTLDVVAGPVAEALIMTAAGLFVAIPATLAYNAFVRVNRRTMHDLADHAHELYTRYAIHADHAETRRPGKVSGVPVAEYAP